MKVTVNGELRSVIEHASVDDLARSVGVGPSGVAVALNGEVVPRSSWSATPLHDGDRVELLGAMQGG
ncbi:MAG: sulfur carrier protein ThiS [Actinomycetota bacterium]|nr:sulfur carrier protein ThiS [Actinomycetota bacterium]MDP9020632.1 sulfur carrier protein ThiS [Actinomycetota bacterium]